MRMILIASALLLAACEMPADEPVTEGACGADTLQHLVGAPAAAAEAEAESRPEAVRIIRPGQPVTMDYRIDRLNFELDENDEIVQVYCG